MKKNKIIINDCFMEIFKNHKYNCFIHFCTKPILFCCFAFLLSLNTFAQHSEHIVILWDVTGSLLPKTKGLKDLSGAELPTFSQGNGMFTELQKAVIDCIEYVEEDPSSQITIVTFHDIIRDTYSCKASEEGKKDLVSFVKNYKYQGHKYTNIVDPIKRFYNLLNNDKINYMFLFTDGDNDQPNTKPHFIPTLDLWTNKTKGHNAFGFYVLVHPDADKPEIRGSIESQENFWIVPDAKVRIKICSLPSSIKYNVRDEKGPKTISMSGKYDGADGEIRLVANDTYYDVFCSDLAINNGKLNVEIKQKSGVTPPVNHTIIITPEVSKADNYTFVGPKQIRLEVSNLPERSLNLTVNDNHFGKASYYDSFLGVPQKNVQAISDINVAFSDQAKVEKSSAVMNVYLVDKKEGKKVSLASQKLHLLINGKEIKDGSFLLTPDMSNVTIAVSGESDTESGTYYGRIELNPSNLDNCSINGMMESFKWRFKFEQKCNPLKLGLIWLLIILTSAFILWMIVLKPMLYPRFGSIRKTFNVPGMAPLIINFKGARMVIVSSSPQKKQSVWNRFWTGKIIYMIHPAFNSPVIFKPCRGRRVLVRVSPGSYQVIPNPMPGIGAATIVDVAKNLKINVN